MRPNDSGEFDKANNVGQAVGVIQEPAFGALVERLRRFAHVNGKKI